MPTRVSTYSDAFAPLELRKWTVSPRYSIPRCFIYRDRRDGWYGVDVENQKGFLLFFAEGFPTAKAALEGGQRLFWTLPLILQGAGL